MNQPSIRTPQLMIALDVPPAELLCALRRIPPQVTLCKIGLELFCGAGPTALQTATSLGKRIFLDLKLHDIPRTVSHAVTAAARHGVFMLTVHALGGRAMLAAAAEAASKCGPHRPLLVAVTTLTSLNQDDFLDLGIQRSVAEQALSLGRMAIESGIDGLVTSVHEAPSLRAELGPTPLLVTPGIRPAGSPVGDQKRVATPAVAIAAGSDYLVVGRPILDAPDPRAAAESILAEMNSSRLRA